jgi:hypothetical protein
MNLNTAATEFKVGPGIRRRLSPLKERKVTEFTRIEFKTVDGTILRGNFFQAQREIVTVMTQGLILLKEHYIDDTARRFQAAGISALVYDHRSSARDD